MKVGGGEAVLVKVGGGEAVLVKVGGGGSVEEGRQGLVGVVCGSTEVRVQC